MPEVDKQSYYLIYPVVCMDESPKQLIGESRIPIPEKPGRAGRYDYEYVGQASGQGHQNPEKAGLGKVFN